MDEKEEHDHRSLMLAQTLVQSEAALEPHRNLGNRKRDSILLDSHSKPTRNIKNMISPARSNLSEENGAVSLAQASGKTFSSKKSDQKKRTSKQVKNKPTKRKKQNEKQKTAGQLEEAKKRENIEGKKKNKQQDGERVQRKMKRKGKKKQKEKKKGEKQETLVKHTATCKLDTTTLNEESNWFCAESSRDEILSWLASWKGKQDLDGLDVFSASGKFRRCMKIAGYKCALYDIKRGKGRHDVTSAKGCKIFVNLLMSLKDNAFVPCGPPCSWFGFMSSSIHARGGLSKVKKKGSGRMATQLSSG